MVCNILNDTSKLFAKKCLRCYILCYVYFNTIQILENPHGCFRKKDQNILKNVWKLLLPPTPGSRCQ